LYQPKTGDTNKKTQAADDCGWRYYLCGAAATAAAIVCHARCDVSAIGLTAGIGIPACTALCLTVQAYGLVECTDKYCP